MRKFIRILMMILVVVALSSCQRSCESFSRSVQVGERYYEVKHYSGGELVGWWTFRGMLNSSESSDGYYWYMDDVLYGVSGDVQIRSSKNKLPKVK